MNHPTQASVSVLGGVVLGRHNQASALTGATVHSLYDVHHLLLVLHGPVDLVVVASAQVNHDVLVPAKKPLIPMKILSRFNHYPCTELLTTRVEDPAARRQHGYCATMQACSVFPSNTQGQLKVKGTLVTWNNKLAEGAARINRE